MSKIQEIIIQNKYQIIISLIFIIGFLIRVIAIDCIPNGFNQDEASAGYEAYSILKYGIDRNGKSMPVHFISWGSGQNVLYSYLMIPFIAILGLNVLAVRLPMAIVGCISLVVVYQLLKKYGKKITIIGLAFFAICPWHIMKSRWGLESNIFPDLVLWGTFIIIRAIERKNIPKFYIGIALLSLSVYSYGTSYMFLPIYILGILIYLLKTKRIKIKNAIIASLIAIVISIPMILFVVINTFDLNEINIGFVTIPRVYQNRFQSVTTIFSSNFISSIWMNLINNLKIILTQTDGLAYNSLKFFGIMFIVSWPFTIIGIINCFKNRSFPKNILNLWSVTACLLLCVMSDANINQLNICMIPLIIYTIIGIYNTTKNKNLVLIGIASMYAILFILFVYSYITTEREFEQDLEEPIKYIDTLSVDKVYISNSFTQPYIYTLFYTKTSTKEYKETVKYNLEKVAFEDIKSYGKFYFYIPSDLSEDNVAYLVPKNYQYDTNKFNEVAFREYKVLTSKDKE